jgi:hypothetical protein
MGFLRRSHRQACRRWMQACWRVVVSVTVDSPEKQRVGIIA